ncbi:MAG: peptidase M13 [Propionibacteriaceae bacterium]|jgi:putative endopeptidase|nr:peptidase M13 [Propionibacteriaceae bacterium]
MTVPALDLSRFDLSQRPADDLYRHVNGGWLATATIPDDHAQIGSFIDLRDRSEKAIHEICEGLAKDRGLDLTSEAGKIAALYRSFVDEERVETVGAAPLTPLLERIEGIEDLDDLREWFGWCMRHGFSSLLETEVESDPGDPTRYLLFVTQDGLGLPDESYYREPQHEAIREQYQLHLARMLALAAGRGEPQQTDTAQARQIWELETAIAATHWDIVKTRDLVAMYNLRTIADLAAEAPDFGWPDILGAAGICCKVKEVVNCQPSFFTEVAALITPDRLDDWKAWARFHLISDLSPYLSKAFVDANFAFYGTALTGQKALRARWKRAVGFTEAAMGEALGKIYVEGNYPAEAARRMGVLIANLLAAYHESISALTWMSDETKAEALKKLESFRAKIGHPVVWRDYSNLRVVEGDLVANVIASNEFDWDYEIGKLAGPINRDEWLMYPQTVNAYYHPLRNEIVFPAAILQPPFFNVDADDAINYGGIGAVIGHEIGHGFDDQGSTCDGEGRLRDWWTEEDRAAFEEATKALIAQYDALSPAQTPELHVNGALTIGENIGDLGGLGIAIKAWRLAGGADAEPIDGYTGLQRLFLSWAACWSYHSHDELVAQRLAVDPHSPAEFRCNQIVRNIDEFYEAFAVTETDAAWLPVADRVTIW